MTPAKDPLLTAARAAILVIRILLVLCTIAIAGLGVVLVVAPDSLGIHAVGGTSRGAIIAAILAVLVLVMIALGLSFDFVGRLVAIINTVRDGEPFAPANAERLTRMGWLSLAVQLLAIPLMLLGAWIQPFVNSGRLRFEVQLSPGGLILALVLFILARVFRQGAAMREELEGTV